MDDFVIFCMILMNLGSFPDFTWDLHENDEFVANSNILYEIH